jgi:TGF-beta propeptide
MVMKNRKLQFLPAFILFLSLLSSVGAYAQITPSQDAFTNSASPTTNFGANVLLSVSGAKEISYIQFNLASIPAGANVSQATLKLYVNAVTKAGSFNVDFVNGNWVESTITTDLSPALGNTIAPNVPITSAEKNQYVLIDITSALQAWLSGSQTNDGIALVANSSFNASFDSKENATTSHPAELDVVFAGGNGTITGVQTGSGSGLTGGGTSGTLNLSLSTACASKQILQWNGTAWACSNAGTGTITGVTAGTDLTGGGASGAVTLNLDTTKVPQLAAANVFTTNQTIAGSSSAIFGLTVSDPNYPGILVQGPEANTGTALELQTTGTGGMSWQILNSGVISDQGPSKLTFRNDSAGLDVMTLLANGFVGIGTTAPLGQLVVEAINSNSVDAIDATAHGPGGLGISAFGAFVEGQEPGGSGVLGVGGDGQTADGDGGEFTGGSGSSNGDGISVQTGTGNAGTFTGNVTVSGTLSAATKHFKIDHPLDPANKYLVHASVESSEMMNIYTGNATTDAQGEAQVQLPDWFEALNTDFRYQLTVIGQFAQAIVSSEVQNHEFAIRSSVPNVKVSWQITGVRHDAFAQANPLVVEEEKDAQLKGFYIHPELYGAPAEKQTEWARHPGMMTKLQQHRQQMQKQTHLAASVKP